MLRPACSFGENQRPQCTAEWNSAAEWYSASRLRAGLPGRIAHPTGAVCRLPWYRRKMAAVESTMLELGTPAPDFSLPDVVSGKSISLASFAGRKGLLV